MAEDNDELEPATSQEAATAGAGPAAEAAPVPGTSPVPAALSIQLEYADRVNLAMQQNGVPLIGRIAVSNTGDRAVEQVRLTVCLENGECEPWTDRIDRIDPGGIYHVEPCGPRLSAAALASRTEAERTVLVVAVEAEAVAARAEAGPGGGGAGVTSISRSFPVDLLAFDHWPGAGLYPELLAAFVTPNHPNIAELLGGARAALGALSGADAIDGYQAGSRRRAAQIAEACFNALLARGIGYVNPPASFERDGQRVRLVDRLCRENMGSCLDLSLLLAGLWEQAGLHPLVLLLEGHAMPAVWMHESHLPEPAIDEAARIRNLIELGDIVPVESTLLTQAGATFAAAVDAAKKRMGAPGSGFCAVDIRSGRKRGVRPLPLRADGTETAVDLRAFDAETVPATPAATLDRVALADRAEGAAAARAAAAAAAAEETGADRIERWKARLLDLSLRNRLVNFHETGRTIRLAVPDVAALEDMLASGERFSIHARSDGDEAFLRAELAERHLYTSEPPAETQKRLLQLYRTARSSIEETGANLLHVAIGMLKWYETAASETPRCAPLILLPATLERRSTGSGYRYDLSLSDEPLRPNVTLLEKLRTDFGIDTTGLDELPEDERGLDVQLILRSFRAAIRESSRWEVEESVFLGLFSFNKFLMWRDLQENMERLRRSRLVQHLVDRAQDEFDPRPFPQPEDLDDTVGPGELYCTRDADSTQLAAVRAAADQRTFVLEGPPGTGKSQTIANIIADSLGRGRRVLFVAEKMAALSVVRRRLEEDGLGPFCLELHSAKASKKEVLAQLEQGLNAARTTEPPDWPALCEGLGITRRQLNTYVRQLHEERASGESLYRVLGRLSLLGDGPRVDLPPGDLTATTKQRLEGWRRLIETIVEWSAAIDPPHDHPLRGIGRSQWSFTLPEETRAALGSASTALSRLADRQSAFLDAAGVAHADRLGLGRDAVHASAVISSHLVNNPVPDRRLLIGPQTPALIADLRQLIALGKERDRRREELHGRYREEIFGLDLQPHIDAARRSARLWGPLRLIAGFFVRRRLRPYCTGGVPDLGTLRADLRVVREVAQTSAQLASAAEAAQVFNRSWKDGRADWETLEKTLAWCEQFNKAAQVLRRDPQTAALAQSLATAASDATAAQAAAPAARALVAAWNDWTAAWKTVKEHLVTSGTQAFGAVAAAGWLAEAAQVLERWSGAIPQLNDWCAWRRARDPAVADGLGDLVERYERGELERGELVDAFERSFGEAWFNAVANTVDSIRDFNAGVHVKTIARFREIDKTLIDRTRFTVAARLREKVPASSSQASGQSELGILRRELEKKRRHLPTRRLIEALPNLLPRLKPCFLMSPLSVAQYLDAGLPLFDLVVFDEASQIPVWDAIGAIARGTEVIVVGDSKQLPPTNFFNTVDSEDESDVEDFAMDDMESILNECNASGVPPMWLRWHYRSRHESLIAFSNHYYYANGLHTFPSPEDRSGSLGVSFRHVADGVYDRGGSRTNRIEAEQVVAEIVRLLTAGPEPDSIGVVTFNQAQQSLIEDLLDARRREMPEIERYFTSEVREPVFVKNLENVQGDERDTVIFSVGYGPDQSGRPSMNFGPLNKEGGERRLNVAVTRARRRLVVFSSLRSDQIDLRRTLSLGVRHFKTFLDYADRGPRAIAEAIDHSGQREFESGFEHAVWKALTERGWEVDAQVGCAGYRVDLAVRDPDRPGRHLLGIECDGAAYHSAKTARDRDRLRQSVLEGLGWRIERVWSTQWWVNPQRCLASLETAIDEARPIEESAMPHREVGPGAGQAAPPAPPPPPAAPAGPPQYRRAAASDATLRRLDIFDRATTARAAVALGEIVRTEGPIVEELAMRRVAEWFGVQRVTDRFRGRFQEIRAAALRTQPVRLAGDVFWPIDMDPAGYDQVRVPGPAKEDRRDIEHVPLVERVNAVVHVLGEQIGLPRADLERETARLLGLQRLTARASEAIGAAVDAALQQGRAQTQGDRVISPP